MADRTFVIDSRELHAVESRLYGYMIGGDDEVYLDEIPGEPTEMGLFVLVQREGDTIRIRQDILGSFGLFLYQNGNEFLLSNSFFRLAERLKGKLTPNRFVIDDLLYSVDVPLIGRQTMANEIRKLDSRDAVVIDVKTGTLAIRRGSREFFAKKPDSSEAFEILDDWYFRWVRIFRKLVSRGVPVLIDVSGGLDTRLILSMLLNGKVDLTKGMAVRSNRPENPKDTEDREIATMLAERYGFRLNEGRTIDYRGELPAQEIYESCKYTSFGRSLMCRYNKRSYDVPVFALKGLASMTKGGGILIGTNDGRISKFTGYPLVKYQETHPDKRDPITREYYRRYLHASCIMQEILKSYPRKEERHQVCYIDQKAIIEGRDALKALDWMNGNMYIVSPFLDPAILAFDYDPENRDQLFLNTVLFYRYAPELAAFPIQGGRCFAEESIKQAKELNGRFPLTPEVFEEAVCGKSVHVSARKWDEEELFAYIDYICHSEDFKRVTEKYMDPLGANRAEFCMDTVRAINEGPHKINAWLAVYEFDRCLHREDTARDGQIENGGTRC